jgi:hypothetical protein
MKIVAAALWTAMIPLMVLTVPLCAQAPPPTVVNKLGIDVEIEARIHSGIDETRSGGVLLPDPNTPVTSIALNPVPQVQARGNDVQVNAPGMDFVQQFSGFRPFVNAGQAEVALAAFGRNIVAGYNDFAGERVGLNPSGPGLVATQATGAGVSVSKDGGQTWRSGFLPTLDPQSITGGDPSVAVDRHGVFFYSTLAIRGFFSDPNAIGGIQVSRSADGGATWSPGPFIADDRSDKEWLAVGPDPNDKSRDNVYVVWVSLQASTCELRLARSTDGGVSFTSKTIFRPSGSPNPVDPQSCLQVPNPVVDRITGTLYVPFLRYSNADQDFIQILISDDAAETFHFGAFNIPGAPDPSVLPITQPGELTQCGGLNFRLTIHGTDNPLPNLFGVPRYIQATRLLNQPTAAARNGVVYLAWSNSDSLVFGSSAGSSVWFIRSDDGGRSWRAPVKVNPVSAADKHHVMPSLAIDEDPNGVHISYYAQHTDTTVDLDMANSHDRGDSFPANRTVRVTHTPFHLAPTNIPLSNAPSFLSTNYNRVAPQCYSLGEYQSVLSANGRVYVAWGDTSSLITEPVNPLDPISGQTHPTEDVFFQEVKAQ